MDLYIGLNKQKGLSSWPAWLFYTPLLPNSTLSSPNFHPGREVSAVLGNLGRKFCGFLPLTVTLLNYHWWKVHEHLLVSIFCISLATSSLPPVRILPIFFPCPLSSLQNHFFSLETIVFQLPFFMATSSQGSPYLVYMKKHDHYSSCWSWHASFW